MPCPETPFYNNDLWLAERVSAEQAFARVHARPHTLGNNALGKGVRPWTVIKVIIDRAARTGYFLDAPPGVAVANGFLMEVGERVVLSQRSPGHRQQTRLEIDYKPDADASAIDAFLLETFEGDQSLVDLIYEIIGVAIFGCGTRYHVVFVFCGEGANGKGVIVALIQMLIPDGMRSSVFTIANAPGLPAFSPGWVAFQRCG